MAVRIQASHAGVSNQSGYSGDEEHLDSASIVKVKISGVNKGLHVDSERKSQQNYSNFFCPEELEA